MFLGNYGYFLRKQEELEEQDCQNGAAKGKNGKALGRVQGDDKPHPQSREGKRLRQQLREKSEEVIARTRQLKKRVDELEHKISTLEKRQTELGEMMSRSDDRYKGQVREIEAESRGIKKRLPKLYKMWEKLHCEQESLMQELDSLAE